MCDLNKVKYLLGSNLKIGMKIPFWGNYYEIVDISTSQHSSEFDLALKIDAFGERGLWVTASSNLEYEIK